MNYTQFQISDAPSNKPLIVKILAWFMLAVALFAWPATWHMTYAQGLPYIEQTSNSNWLDESFQIAQATIDPIEQKLMNQRAGRLMKRDSAEILRQPNVEYDADVRMPNLNRDPNDKEMADKQAAKLKEVTDKEIIESAQRGQDAASSFIGKVRGDVKLELERADPENRESMATGTVNITEIIPGYSQQGMPNIQGIGGYFYRQPELIKSSGENVKKNLRKDGCRKTDFSNVEYQDINKANISAKDRILKVEFFDIVKKPIPNTNPVAYDTEFVPSVYKEGDVNIGIQAIGGASNVYWDYIDEKYAIKYTYTPYTAPSNKNFLVYNVQVALDYGSGPHVLTMPNNPNLISYGSAKDAWTPVFSSNIPKGVKAFYMSADLYQTAATYTEPVVGQSCEPDPPTTCEVTATDGRVIRFCTDSPGANIISMFDDWEHPDERFYAKKYNDMALNNANTKDYEKDSQVLAGVQRGINIGSSAIAKELAGTCRRELVSYSEQEKKLGTYHVEEIEVCSESLVNPMPDGYKGIKRSFGLAYVSEHNFLKVRAFNKKKVPIKDPNTGEQIKDKEGYPLFTYLKEPANVNGPIRTDFTIMGGAVCPGQEGCSTEIPDDPRGGSEGYFVEYVHIPMGGNRREFAFNNVYLEAGGISNFTHYGKPDNGWMPTGVAQGDGTRHELRLMASVYSIPVNDFTGGEKYMKYAADGFCKGAKLICKDSSPTRTIGGVKFGPGLPNDGIVDILKDWGTSASAEHIDFGDGNGEEPTPTGPPLILLDNKMCWEADAEPFTSCNTIDDPEGRLKYYFKEDGTQWATDCNITPDKNDVPLDKSPSCKRVPAYDSCDSRFEGIFSGTCYNSTVTYDCGKDVETTVSYGVSEYKDVCNGVVRCMGTQCHRPNLSGDAEDQFTQAVTGMEAINFMVAEMVCAETGKAPTSPDQECSPLVFGGKPFYCKIPIGHGIGITPQCCKEAKKGAKSGPTWMEYLQATKAIYKIARTEAVQNFMKGFDIYNNAAKHFGEVATKFNDVYSGASNWVSQNIVKPFSAGFDNLFGDFGIGNGSTASTTAMDSLSGKSIDKISGVIDQLKQKMMKFAYELLKQISHDLANAVFTVGTNEAGQEVLSMSPALEALNTAFMIYSIAKLIGHIIFACKQEEFEWGMNDRWRLCTYVDTCCSKKIKFIGCIEKRQLYCCFKSIVARIMNEQITKQNLSGSKKFGFRTNPQNSNKKLGGCSINCSGFTPLELSMVDWTKVDLTEWTDSMIEAGLLNPSDPRTNYGVTEQSIPISSTAGSLPASQVPEIDQRSAAYKTVKGWEKNMDKITRYGESLKSEEAEQCYDEDNKKMPFTYPGCKKSPN